MASRSGVSEREARVPPPVAGGAPSNADAPVDTAHLDSLVVKAFTAAKSGRYGLAAAFFRHMADEALRVHLSHTAALDSA